MASDSAGSNAQCVIVSADPSDYSKACKQQVSAKHLQRAAAGMQAAGSRAEPCDTYGQRPVLGELGNCLSSSIVRSRNIPGSCDSMLLPPLLHLLWVLHL